MPISPFLPDLRMPGSRGGSRRQLMTSVMPSPRDTMDVPSQPFSEPDEHAGTDKISPHTDRSTSNITILPNELLIHIVGYLAFDNIQYLGPAFLHTYKQTQKDLRSVCLVSKQLEAVTRQYLYRAVMVNNADVLVYLVRTLDENRALGQHIKRLVFDVPFMLEDVHYRKLNVAVLRSRRNFTEICAMAAVSSDFAQYQWSVLHTRMVSENRYPELPDLPFDEWAWRKERKILGHLHFEILLRSNNIESLYFGSTCFGPPAFMSPYMGLLSQVGLAMGGGLGHRKVPGFMPKLQKLQLLGEGPLSPSFARSFLEIPSLQTLQFFHDNGTWFSLDPLEDSGFRMPPRLQYRNITCIDLQRTHCTLPAIFQICATFPLLESLLVSGEHGANTDSLYGLFDRSIDGFGTRIFLSTGLAKLEHLRELALDLHYKQDAKPMLGEYGVLNLRGLKKLTKLRLPLHFLVEAQPGNAPFVTDLKQVLPPSVEQLTVWADTDSVRHWGSGPTTLMAAAPPHLAVVPYHPRQSALDFLGWVSGVLTTHFKHLKEVTYCYADQALNMVCQCNADTLCNRCEACQLLDVHATDDSSARIKALSLSFETRGVCLRISQEHYEDTTTCFIDWE